MHHCINYLRQLILCQPDLTLEPQSYFLHDQLHKQGVDGLGVTHTCRDWTQVYAALEDNWAEYQIWLNGTVALVLVRRSSPRTCAYATAGPGDRRSLTLRIACRSRYLGSGFGNMSRCASDLEEIGLRAQRADTDTGKLSRKSPHFVASGDCRDRRLFVRKWRFANRSARGQSESTNEGCSCTEAYSEHRTDPKPGAHEEEGK